MSPTAKRGFARLLLVVAAFAALGGESCFGEELFNGRDLTGWYTFIRGCGRDNDPMKVITVTNGMIHITGEEWGALITEREYANYRLTVEYRFDGTLHGWKKKRSYAPDSGILFHSVGPDAAFAECWLASHEYNLIQGGSGDFWTAHPKGADMFLEAEVAPTKQGGRHYVWQRGGQRVRISGNERIARRDIAGEWRDRADAPLAPNEYPIGQWNTAVLECRGERVLCYFNGKLVNEAVRVKPTRGKIQLQSEGCGIDFRRVTLEPLAAP